MIKLRVEPTSRSTVAIVNRVKLGHIVYEEARHWDKYKISLLIESILMRVPIGEILIDGTSSPQTIVDGVRRIDGIFLYMEDALPLERLEFIDCSGKKFSELEIWQQRRIEEGELSINTIIECNDRCMKQSIVNRLSNSVA